MRILFIGDVVGRPGRKAVGEILPSLYEKYRPDLVIANGENAAGGNGITEEVAAELFSEGIDFLTMGNHVWDQKDVFNFIDYEERIIRPANYPPGTPGRGFTVIKARSGTRVGVINLSGRTFMPALDCPFRAFDGIIDSIKKETRIVIVDLHAEATSEKMAFGWYVDGRVSAVLGTHTHVQTADERILPKGTAYITDAGMTGSRDSVLGVKIEPVITKFLTQRPVRFEVAGGSVMLNGVYLELDEVTGSAYKIERICIIK